MIPTVISTAIKVHHIGHENGIVLVVRIGIKRLCRRAEQHNYTVLANAADAGGVRSTSANLFQ